MYQEQEEGTRHLAHQNHEESINLFSKILSNNYELIYSFYNVG